MRLLLKTNENLFTETASDMNNHTMERSPSSLFALLFFAFSRQEPPQKRTASRTTKSSRRSRSRRRSCPGQRFLFIFFCKRIVSKLVLMSFAHARTTGQCLAAGPCSSSLRTWSRWQRGTGCPKRESSPAPPPSGPRACRHARGPCGLFG